MIQVVHSSIESLSNFLTVMVVGTGEEPATGIIASITNGNPSLVTCVDDERLTLEVGDAPTVRLVAYSAMFSV